MAAPIDEAALVELRKCEKAECLFTVPNAVKDLSLILQWWWCWQEHCRKFVQWCWQEL